MCWSSAKKAWTTASSNTDVAAARAAKSWSPKSRTLRGNWPEKPDLRPDYSPPDRRERKPVEVVLLDLPDYAGESATPKGKPGTADYADVRRLSKKRSLLGRPGRTTRVSVARRKPQAVDRFDITNALNSLQSAQICVICGSL